MPTPSRFFLGQGPVRGHRPGVSLLFATVWVLALSFFIPTCRAETGDTDSLATILSTELLSTRKTRITAYPYAYYTPETQFAFGVGGIATFYTDEDLILRPSKVDLSAYYTSNSQYRISTSTDIFFRQNTLLILASADYGRYVDKFWGIGSETPETGDEEYIQKAWSLYGEAQLPPLLPDENKFRRSGLILDLSSTDITDRKDNLNLLEEDLVGKEGGRAFGLGLVFSRDSRNHVFYPTRGGRLDLRATFLMRAIGSDFDFNRYTADLRHFIPLGASDRALALMFLGDVARGTPPFFELPALGGSSIMRGYFLGRFRDQIYLAGQAELRSHLWRRFGGVVFVGAGDVASEPGGFRFRQIKYSLGFGLRFLFSKAEKVNLRADLGFGRDTSGVYFGLEEAF